MQNVFLQLQEKIKDLYYFSETEYPVIFYTMADKKTQVIPFISNLKDVAEECIKKISPEDFFKRFDYYINNSRDDKEIFENAVRFLDIREFLNTKFKNFTIYRIRQQDTAHFIYLIIITTYDNHMAALEALSLETG